VAFCHELGLDYVSCSPYRVPIARLAAAQAAVTVLEQQETQRASRTVSRKKSTVSTKKTVVKKAVAKKNATTKKAASHKSPSKKKTIAKKSAAKLATRKQSQPFSKRR
jgi:pyruvate,orthophosphate dikinase